MFKEGQDTSSSQAQDSPETSARFNDELRAVDASKSAQAGTDIPVEFKPFQFKAGSLEYKSTHLDLGIAISGERSITAQEPKIDTSNPFLSDYTAPTLFKKPQPVARNYYEK